MFTRRQILGARTRDRNFHLKCFKCKISTLELMLCVPMNVHKRNYEWANREIFCVLHRQKHCFRFDRFCTSSMPYSVQSIICHRLRTLIICMIWSAQLTIHKSPKFRTAYPTIYSHRVECFSMTSSSMPWYHCVFTAYGTDDGESLEIIIIYCVLQIHRMKAHTKLRIRLFPKVLLYVSVMIIITTTFTLVACMAYNVCRKRKLSNGAVICATIAYNSFQKIVQLAERGRQNSQYQNFRLMYRQHNFFLRFLKSDRTMQ